MDWQLLLQTFGGTAVAVAAVAWLARSLTTHVLSRDFEEFRNRLAREAKEREVRLHGLVTRQADVVAGVYARLEALHLAYRRWAGPTRPAGLSSADLNAAAAKAFDEFANYYYANAIWLDRATCDTVNSIVAEFWAVHLDLTLDVDDRGMPRDRHALRVAYNRVTKGIPEARTALDLRFRKLLGVEDAPALPAVPPLPDAGQTA